MLLSALILLGSGLVYAVELNCDVGQYTQMTANVRDNIEKTHNKLRSQLAQGEVMMPRHNFAKPGTQIYELKYDCELEKEAQTRAQNCDNDLLSLNEDRMNGYSKQLTAGGGVSDVEELSTYAMNEWWKEIETHDVQNYEEYNPADGETLLLRHWSQMAWGDSTRVGCSLAICHIDGASSYHENFVCLYKTGRGALEIGDVYVKGTACEDEAQCTVFPDSKCDLETKLCRISKQ